jgi:hypothetical protein
LPTACPDNDRISCVHLPELSEPSVKCLEENPQSPPQIKILWALGTPLLLISLWRLLSEEALASGRKMVVSRSQAALTEAAWLALPAHLPYPQLC